MSWAEEDWTVGLSGRVLQKVKELEVHKERLSRENKQKQLQLDNINISLEKQTVKYEEVRGELQSVHRELQSVQEEAKAAVTSRERLNQELHTRQAHVCSLEGQLDTARTLNNKLTQEIKRLEAELEKLQNSGGLPDTTLFSTPCWNPSSPWDHNASRQEDRSGRWDEGQSRAHHMRQRLQLSETPSPSPQQQRSTPYQHPSNQPNNCSTPLAAFPWEREDSGPASRRRLPFFQTSSPDTSQILPEKVPCGKDKEQKEEAEVSASETQNRVILLEEELSEKVRALKSIQSDLVQTKKELAARELNLQRARDELGVARTHTAQERERTSETEQKLKQLQEELKCQRQNAESSRLQHQHRTKELEKQHQRDVTELQKERQYLEKQHQQEVNKLNQELQQATMLHNALQAQADKLSLQNQALDKELDTLKGKLKWTEEQLMESQKKEAQMQSKLTEAVREAEGVAVSLEQSRKRERALEEEGRRLAEDKADTLRRLKELQEQTCAAPLQPPQFCPTGQTFSSHSSFTPHPPPPVHTRRPAAIQAGTKREDDVEEGMADVAPPYPSDREPGEGIDAEQITVATNSESLPGQVQTRKRNDLIGRDITGRDGNCSSHPGMSIISPVGDDGEINPEDTPPRLSVEKSFSLKSEPTVLPEDLKRENVLLRSELRDVREELQKRLEDLEAQRRAESETRTRLKQLSRKNASQTAERDEKEKEWRAQLENGKAETERLRREIAALESELKRDGTEREKMEKEEERNSTKDDRECELIELNIQLKTQLAEVKAQLALEREERKQEEEERKRVKNADVDEELSRKLAELMAEVEELKHIRKDDLRNEEKLSISNSPLTYLTLHHDELNSNVVGPDDKLLPSPEQHHLFCQSTNQLNILMSTPAADGTQEVQQNSPEPSGTDRATSDEVERLRREYAKETERANQYQVKLEALQNQVTRQTQQLTVAFDSQSQNISSLLVELEEKEKAFLVQGEELLRCKRELDVLKTQTREQIKEGEEDGERHQASDLEHGDEHVVTLADADLNSERDASQPKTETCDAETLTRNKDICPEAERPNSASQESYGDSVGGPAENESSKTRVPADECTELSTLRRENQLLKQRIRDLTEPGVIFPSLQRDSEAQGDSVKQSQNSEKPSPSFFKELQTQSVPAVLSHEGRQLLNYIKRSEAEELQKEDRRTRSGETDLEEVSEVQINHLQQQVEALQRQVRSLSEETQQQAQELTVWRLASQPLPTLDPFSTGADDQRGGPEPVTWTSQENITVVREDELSLCCSANKLQGRMLFSRLQNQQLPESNSLSSSKVTAGVLEVTAETNQGSEKEKQINLKWSNSGPDQHKVKRNTELIHRPKMVDLEAKNHHTASGPSPTGVEESCTGNAEAEPGSSRATGRVNTTEDVATETKNVGSQTEESLYPTVCATTQTEEKEEDEGHQEAVGSPSSEKVEPEGKTLFSGSFPIPADPARLAERILRNRTQLSAAFDDTEYEPYGLPEVVMKGFADIPSGPSCPYIVRRGLLGTAVMPTSEKDPQQEEETD